MQGLFHSSTYSSTPFISYVLYRSSTYSFTPSFQVLSSKDGELNKKRKFDRSWE
jgi:hypothetical protein